MIYQGTIITNNAERQKNKEVHYFKNIYINLKRMILLELHHINFVYLFVFLIFIDEIFIKKMTQQRKRKEYCICHPRNTWLSNLSKTHKTGLFYYNCWYDFLCHHDIYCQSWKFIELKLNNFWLSTSKNIEMTFNSVLLK